MTNTGGSRRQPGLSQELSAFVTGAADAVVITNTDGDITFWNDSAETLVGYTATEVLGKSFLVFVSDECAASETKWRREGLDGDRGGNHESVWRHKDGRRLDVSVTISPVLTKSGARAGTSAIAREITDRRALERSALHLAAIVESSDDAIVSKDLNSIVRSWNSAAEKLFGFTADEIIGRSVRLLIPFERQLEEDDVLARIRNGERVDHYETIRRRKDGSLVPVSLTVSPIRRPDGTVIGASKIARDISDRERAEQERQRLLTIARDASQLKDEFLATLSHELRTPLNAIFGYIRLAQSKLLTGDKLDHAIDAVSRNATLLTQIVEDVLDVSRIVAGQVRIELQPVDLRDSIKNAVDTVRPAADAKGITLDYERVLPGITVMADPVRLQQIMWNLFANAVKFTDAGGRVNVRVELQDPVVVITVSDTGIGIPTEFLPHVFDRFRQLDSAMTRTQGGLGLGLSIAKHLLELHGGRIGVHSDGPGTGSTFRVELPLQNARAKAVRAAATGNVSPAAPGLNLASLRGVRVVAVDDDADALALIQEILEAVGAQVVTATSGQDALRVLETTTPHLLITDLGMPQMSGLQLIDAIRSAAREEIRCLPAIALTAFARSEDRTKAIRRGFNLHVAKPVDPGELLSAIAMVLGRPLA